MLVAAQETLHALQPHRHGWRGTGKVPFFPQAGRGAIGHVLLYSFFSIFHAAHDNRFYACLAFFFLHNFSVLWQS